MRSQLPTRLSQISGWTILSIFLLTALVCNLSMAYVLENRYQFEYCLPELSTGFFISQILAIVTVASLIAGSFRLRCLFFVAGMAFSFSGLFLGWQFCLPTNESLSSSGFRNLAIMGILSMPLMGFSVPFLFLRWLRRRRLTRYDSQPESANSQFSIAQVLITTTVVAMSLGSIEIGNAIAPDRQRWQVAGVLFLMAFGVSQFICVPVVYSTFTQRSKWFWKTATFVFMLLVPFVAMIIFEAIDTGGRSFFFSRRQTFEFGAGIVAVAQGYFWALLGTCLIGTKFVKLPSTK